MRGKEGQGGAKRGKEEPGVARRGKGARRSREEQGQGGARGAGGFISAFIPFFSLLLDSKT